MPGAGFKRRAMRAHDDLQVWQVRGVEMVKEDMVSYVAATLPRMLADDALIAGEWEGISLRHIRTS